MSSKYNAVMKLNKDMEDAKRKGYQDEVAAYETLAKFRQGASDQVLSKILNVLDLTKTLRDKGFDASETGLFEPGWLRETLRQEEEKQIKILDLMTGLLRSEMGGRAAIESARGQQGRVYRQFIPPDKDTLADISAAATGVVRMIGAEKGYYTPSELLMRFDHRIGNDPNRIQELFGSKGELSRDQTLFLVGLRNKLRSLPADRKVRLMDVVDQMLGDPGELVKLGISSGKEIIYNPQGKPVEQRPITRGQVPSAKPQAPAGLAHVPGTGGQDKSKSPNRFVNRNGALIDTHTNRQITSRAELESILNEMGYRYNPEKFDRFNLK